MEENREEEEWPTAARGQTIGQTKHKKNSLKKKKKKRLIRETASERETGRSHQNTIRHQHSIFPMPLN